MFSALTWTPITSTRGTSAVGESGNRIGHLFHPTFGDLGLYPAVGPRDAFFERDLRFPSENVAQPIVVGIASAHALWSRDVPLRDGDAGRGRDEVGEGVDADQPVLSEIERLAIARLHQPVQAFDAVVYVAERSRLLAVAPDLDLVVTLQPGNGDLAAQCGRRFFAPAIPRAERSKDVVEANDADVEAVVLAVMP